MDRLKSLLLCCGMVGWGVFVFRAVPSMIHSRFNTCLKFPFYDNMSTQILPLLTIIHHFIYLPLCYKVFILIYAANTLILLMFSITPGIYCTSVHPGRGIPHMWLSLRFLRSFYPVKSFFFVVFPYSCWGLRAEDVTPC